MIHGCLTTSAPTVGQWPPLDYCIMPTPVKTWGGQGTAARGDACSPASKQRLLLLDLRQSALQILHALLQPLIVQTQQVQAIQELFALNPGPFQRTPQSGQLQLRLLSVVGPGTHARPLSRIIGHSYGES